MPKHILILNGSPRHNGNTANLISWLNNTLQNAKHTVSQHDLYPLNFKGCKHCDACKKNSANPACILQDDFTPILEDIVAADIIVIASPIYCWSFSGCMSTALDRFYCLFKRKGPSLFAGKKFVGLFTAGGDYFDGMELCVTGLKELTQHGQAEYVGTVSAIFCDDKPMQEQKQRLTEALTDLVTKL